MPYEGRIPRMAPLVALVRRTIGPLARAYLSADAEFDGYRAFRRLTNTRAIGVHLAHHVYA